MDLLESYQSRRERKVAGAIGFKRSREYVKSGVPRRMTTALKPRGEAHFAAAVNATTTAAAIDHLQHSLLPLGHSRKLQRSRWQSIDHVALMISQRQEEGEPSPLKT